VATDPKRFEHPMTMTNARAVTLELWDSRDVVKVRPTESVVHRVTELMQRHRLGRRRILDTALAATLEGQRLRRLAAMNSRDYRAFSFLEIVDPTAGSAAR